MPAVMTVWVSSTVMPWLRAVVVAYPSSTDSVT